MTGLPTAMRRATARLSRSPSRPRVAEDETSQRLGVLTELARLVLREPDLDTVLTAAVTQVSETLGADFCKVLELRPDADRLVMRAGTGWKEGSTDSFAVRSGVGSQAGYTLVTGAPVVVDDLREETRFGVSALLSEHGAVSGVSVPIAGSNGSPFGVLAAYRRTRRAFSELDARFVESVADVVALALAREHPGDEPSASQTQLGLGLEAARDDTAEEQFRELVEQLPLAVYVSRPDEPGPVDYVSPQIEGILGYRVDDWLSDPALYETSLHPDDRTRVMAELRAARRNGRRFSAEYRMVAPDGRVVWVHDETIVVADEVGGPGSVHGYLLDISERKQAEEQRDRLESTLRHLQKMEAVGQLAEGIAHDFNNLLVVIKGYTESALSRIAETDPELGADLEEVRHAAEQAAALTRQLLAFGRRHPVEPRVLDLNEIVADVGKLLRRLLGDDIELVLRHELALGAVEADPGQLEQVLVNLAVNARDAMPGGGRLTIETANVELDEVDVGPNESVAAGPYALLAVTDTGEGMDAQTLERAFEPFFTTKAPGKGTGLGLATVYGIVKQSGGHVWAASEPGRGTTFEVYLPRVAVSVNEEPSW